ncbi:MarR family winged helix-turn-helix transcriptional regulator [uncultured Amnibacterium sp.]|uniref:MarR family winged helix-turn-helix transcriptional regulator n=1 Tax=uncultured Amnibacterium sp. TaxID=1631851 RepID=UPI0035CCA4C5
MDTDAAIRSVDESFERIAVGARRSIRRAAGELAADLPPSAWPVLREVLRAGRVQAGTIIGSLGMDKSAVSRHLKELREHGLVDAERDEHDGRSIWIRPTPLAIERSATILAGQQDRLRDLLEAWEPGDLERFADLLHRFAELVPPAAD